MKLLRCLFIVFVFGCKIDNQTKPTSVSKEFKAKKELENFLISIHDSDQKYRWEVLDLIKFHPNEKDKIKALDKKISQIDERNFKIIDSLVSKNVWIGINEIDYVAQSTQFLVIQHSNNKKDFDKYQPIIEKAWNDKKESPEHYAMFTDRYLIFKGKKQLYGTQYYFKENKKKVLSPMEDSINVNKRRHQIGIDTSFNSNIN